MIMSVAGAASNSNQVRERFVADTCITSPRRAPDDTTNSSAITPLSPSSASMIITSYFPSSNSFTAKTLAVIDVFVHSTMTSRARSVVVYWGCLTYRRSSSFIWVLPNPPRRGLEHIRVDRSHRNNVIDRHGFADRGVQGSPVYSGATAHSR